MKKTVLLLALLTTWAMQAFAADGTTAKAANDNSKEVCVGTPGTLEEIVENITDSLTSLTVTGTINSVDLAYLNRGTGKMGAVTALNLSAVNLHCDGGCYASISEGGAFAYTGASKWRFYLSTRSACDTTNTSSGTFPSYSVQVYNVYGHDLAGAFSSNNHLKNVVLPRELSAVGAYMFNRSDSIEHVDIPDGASEIGERAFYGCKSLTDIHWPLHLKSVGPMAFYSCERLTAVSLPEGVTAIGAQAFFLCDNLRTFYIPSTVTTILPGGISGNIIAIKLDKVTTVTCTSSTPLPIGRFYLPSRTVGKVRVPAASLEDYKVSSDWSDLANVIEPIEGLSATSSNVTTTFAKSGIDESSDLTDTVVGNVYFSLSDGDFYQTNDGSITILSTMNADDMDAIGGMVPCFTDLAYRFAGLTTMVSAGKGSVSIDCQTIGSHGIGVKVGTKDAAVYTKSERGTIVVDYDVAEPTCIYIYGTDNGAVQTHAQSRGTAADESNCVKLYSLAIQNATGITSIKVSNPNAVVGYYDLSGRRAAVPKKGVYIVKYNDGTTVKQAF